jgi:hypothetical protein
MTTNLPPRKRAKALRFEPGNLANGWEREPDGLGLGRDRGGVGAGMGGGGMSFWQGFAAGIGVACVIFLAVRFILDKYGVGSHVHVWGKWEDWGIIHQSRYCATCGRRQIREAW